jgi:hypothetical protein
VGKKSTESGGYENRAVPKFGTFLCRRKKMSYTESKKERHMTNRNRNRRKSKGTNKKVTDRKVEMKERVLFGKLNAAVSIRLKRVFQST